MDDNKEVFEYIPLTSHNDQFGGTKEIKHTRIFKR